MGASDSGGSSQRKLGVGAEERVSATTSSSPTTVGPSKHSTTECTQETDDKKRDDDKGLRSELETALNDLASELEAAINDIQSEIDARLNKIQTSRDKIQDLKQIFNDVAQAELNRGPRERLPREETLMDAMIEHVFDTRNLRYLADLYVATVDMIEARRDH